VQTATTALTHGRDLGRVRSYRHALADGAATTVHAAVYDRADVTLEVVAMAPAEQLAGWCARAGVADAIVGGFFVTPVGTPLGELWVGGARHDTTPFDAPWGAVRSCVGIAGDRIDLGPRDAFALRPGGDLLQAGPLLARDGAVAGAALDDREGFTAGSRQFDSDIRDGRHPRAALGIDAGPASPDRSGWLVPPDDEAALADTLVQAAADAGERARRGAAGRAYVLERFAWPALARRVEDLYAAVAALARR